MDKANSQAIIMPVLITEFFATMLFEFSYNINEGAAPIALALTLTAIIVMTQNISGGHLNPAVSIGVYIIEGRNHFKNNCCYLVLIIIAQLMGAFGGLALGFLVRTAIPREDDPNEYIYVPD